MESTSHGELNLTIDISFGEADGGGLRLRNFLRKMRYILTSLFILHGYQRFRLLIYLHICQVLMDADVFGITASTQCLIPLPYYYCTDILSSSSSQKYTTDALLRDFHQTVTTLPSSFWNMFWGVTVAKI